MNKTPSVGVKLMAILSIVRWYNIIAIGIALYLSAIFPYDAYTSKRALIMDYRLHLNVLSVALIVMSGYIINSFYDLEKDLVNRPNHTLFARVVSKRSCLNAYVIFNVLGLIFSFFVSKWVFVYMLLLSAGLWMFSHKFRKIAVIGELSASVLTIAPFFSIAIYFDSISHEIVEFVLFIFMVDFAREIIKRFESIKGDLIYEYASIPISYGGRVAKFVAHSTMAISLIYFAILNYNSDEILMHALFAVTSFILIAAAIQLYFASKVSEYKVVHTLFKTILILSILAITLI